MRSEWEKLPCPCTRDYVCLKYRDKNSKTEHPTPKNQFPDAMFCFVQHGSRGLVLTGLAHVTNMSQYTLTWKEKTSRIKEEIVKQTWFISMQDT